MSQDIGDVSFFLRPRGFAGVGVSDEDRVMSGNRKLTAPGVLRLAVELDLLPSEAEIRRDGSVRWKSETLSYVGFVYREEEDLVWAMWVGDTNYDNVDGMMSVPIMGVPISMPWPTRVDDELTTFLRSGLGEAAQFVKSREDLCLLLASRDDVRRGHVSTRFFEGNYPARFVQALVLARDLGRADLEADVLGKLQGLKEEGEFGTARGWAAMFGRQLKMKIPLE